MLEKRPCSHIYFFPIFFVHENNIVLIAEALSSSFYLFRQISPDAYWKAPEFSFYFFFCHFFSRCFRHHYPPHFPCDLSFNPPKRKFSVAHVHLPFYSAEQVTSVHSHSSGRMSSLLSLAEGKQPIHVLPCVFFFFLILSGVEARRDRIAHQIAVELLGTGGWISTGGWEVRRIMA